MLSAFAAVAVCVAAAAMPVWTLLVFLALPAAALTLRALREREAAALNALVRGAARLHLHLGLLLALGFVIETL